MGRLLSRPCCPRALCGEIATEGTRRVPQVEGAGEAGQVAQSLVNILPHPHREHGVYTRAHTGCTRVHTAGGSRARLGALCRPGPARPGMGVMDELCPRQLILEAGTDRAPVTNRAAPLLSLHEHTCRHQRRREKTTEKPGGCQGRPLTDAVTCFCDVLVRSGKRGPLPEGEDSPGAGRGPQGSAHPHPCPAGEGEREEKSKEGAPAEVSSL